MYLKIIVIEKTQEYIIRYFAVERKLFFRYGSRAIQHTL